MPEIAPTVAVLNAIKSAMDIATSLRESALNSGTTDLKSSLADLMMDLADARLRLAEVQELVDSGNREIQRLKDRAEKTAMVVKHHDAYYEKGDGDFPLGDPYCLHCWEVSKRLIHLYLFTQGRRACTVCKNIYLAHNTPAIEKRQQLPHQKSLDTITEITIESVT